MVSWQEFSILCQPRSRQRLLSSRYLTLSNGILGTLLPATEEQLCLRVDESDRHNCLVVRITYFHIYRQNRSCWQRDILDLFSLGYISVLYEKSAFQQKFFALHKIPGAWWYIIHFIDGKLRLTDGDNVLRTYTWPLYSWTNFKISWFQNRHSL